MKIRSVRPLFIDRFLYVQIETDTGLVGLGESGTWGHLEASAAAIHKFGEYLVGKDPRPIERHWNVMIRAHHFTGAAITGAISAIDIALWDLKGKIYNAPIFDMLGGAVRTQARLYGHVKGSTIEVQIEQALRMKSQGFTALGHLNPLLDEKVSSVYYKSHARKIEDAIDNVRAYREALGPDVDLCIELHRRLTQSEAIVLARGIEEFHPMFFEDPLPPHNLDSMAYVTDQIPIPVATGERFTSVQHFGMLLKRNGVQYLRPCICIVGGITAGKKIAALAETYDAQIVPHNPLSPVSLAACLQLDACIPNLGIQEYPSANREVVGDDKVIGHSLVSGMPAPSDGFITIPNGPGLGVELLAEAEKNHPPRVRPIEMRCHKDGGVVDQ